MNNIDDIKLEIKKLKKIEQFRKNKIESFDKKQNKVNLKLKKQTKNQFDEFESLLEQLSTFYERFDDDIDCYDEDTVFLSEHDPTKLERTETMIDIQLGQMRDAILAKQKHDDDCLTTTITIEQQRDYRQSLHLKHEAEMSKVKLEMELAGLEAQIDWLTRQNQPKPPTTKESVSELLEEMSALIKSNCCNESLVQVSRQVEARLNSQTVLARLLSQIAEQCHRRSARYETRLAELNKEHKFHEDMERIFSDLSSLFDDFSVLRSTIESVDLNENTAPNEHDFLFRFKSHFPASDFPDIHNSLATDESIKAALVKENNTKEKLIGELSTVTNESINFLEKIFQDVNQYQSFMDKNGSLHRSSRFTLNNRKNAEQIHFAQISSEKFKKRLRQLKKEFEKLEVDIKISE